MNFYLTYVNPALAVLILLICAWIYIGGYFTNFEGEETAFSDGKSILDPNEMGFPLYFFAKGLFCSAMLFLFGEFMKRYLARD